MEALQKMKKVQVFLSKKDSYPLQSFDKNDSFSFD